MTTSSASLTPPTDEHADLLEALAKHRGLLLGTVEGLDDEQAAARPTVSELSLGGLVKHLTAVERQWAGFVVDGPWRFDDLDWAAIDWADPPPAARVFRDGFRMLEGETLAGLVADYRRAAAATDAVLCAADLSVRQPLPAAPWFPPGAEWSARRVAVHLMAETAQHAGHADILREAIDGRKSMG